MTGIETALLEAVRKVVPAGIEVDGDTSIEATNLDSLGILEVLVHLEDGLGKKLDEDVVRSISLTPDYDLSMPLSAFAKMLLGYYEDSAVSGLDNPEMH